MMKNYFSVLFLALVTLSILLIPSAYAGKIDENLNNLKTDSYDFEVSNDNTFRSANVMISSGELKENTFVCPQISNLQVDLISETTVDFSWTPGGSETAWEYIVQPAGGGYPTGAGTPTGSFNVSEGGLTGSTDYEIYVRADCGGEFSNWNGPVAFTTSCPVVTDLTLLNVTATQALFSFTSSSSNVSWEYVIQPANTGEPTTVGTFIGSSPVTINNITPNTDYEVYIRANCGVSPNSDYSDWVGPLFISTLADYIVNCGAGGTPVNYCYENNDTTLFHFTTTTAQTVLNLTFNSGTLEDGVDSIIVYDYDGTTVLYSGSGNAGNLAGLEVQGNGDELFIEVISDGANSCATGEQTTPMDFIVTCNTCVAPSVTFSLVNDCGNGQQFLGGVEITDMGSASSITITDNQANTAPVTVTDVGEYTIGPYQNGTNVILYVINDDNAQCTTTSGVMTQTECPLIEISTTEYDYEGLVKDVLIDSECAQVSNVQGSTGVNYGDVNGIGYFYNAFTFSFESGVVLSSGDVNNVPGPNNANAQSDGTGAWLGDADLDSFLAAGDTSRNASYLEFDFIPSTSSISFDFLFASEEYTAAWECVFSDVFAFILTDSDGNSSNLAVVPGTTIPVTVVNVHGGIGSCGPANPMWFDEYLTVGTGVIDFMGYTRVMTASSAVVPGESYHIKLVLGDEGDTAVNSAVFLGAGTFDIGGGLGEDLLVSNQTAPCESGEAVLELPDGPNNVYQWYFNGNAIPGATSNTYTVAIPENGGFGEGSYKVEAQIGGNQGCAIIDSVMVEFAPMPVLGIVNPYQICETENVDGYEEFDLTTLETQLMNGISNMSLEYYLTEDDAAVQENEITVPQAFTNTVEDGQTIYVRLQSDLFEDCFDLGSFEIVVASAVAGDVEDYELCDAVTENDGYEVFDLTTVNEQVLDNENPNFYTITFYEDEDEALDGDPADAIQNPETYTNSNINLQTIYARLEDNLSGCADVTSFSLIVLPVPTSITPTPLYGCDNDGDGYVTFMLNEKNSEILNDNAPGINVFYYESMAALEADGTPLASAYTNTSTPSQTIYVKLVNLETGCFNVTTLELIVSSPPVANIPSPLEFCDPDNDGFGIFDIESVNNEVIPNDGLDYNVTYHVTQDDAENDVNEFYSIYENIVPNMQTMYVRVENSESHCYDVVPLQLIVNPTPIVPTTLDDLEICDDNVADGFAEFDLTLQNPQVYGSQSTSEYTISYHASLTAAEDGVQDLPFFYTNIYAFQQTIYVRLENNTTGCYTTREFDLIVHPNPVIAVDYDNTLELCDDFGEPGDELLIFDLTVENDEVTGDVNGYAVSYYHTSADAQSGDNQIINDTAYQNTVNPETLFVRVEDVNTGCTSFTTVTLRVLNNPTPLADIEPQETCDDDTDGDENNGQAVFDLTIDELAMLNGEGGVTPVYYETYEDAFDGVNAITDPTAYYNITPYLQTIYVRVTNDVTGCYTITTFDLIVHPLPAVTDAPVYYLCEYDNDYVETFPLTDMDSFVMDGGDTTDLEITYYNTLADAEDDTAELVGPNITVNGTRAIFARVYDEIYGCVQTIAYTIEIRQAPLANKPEPVALCDVEHELADGTIVPINDGIEIFDLTAVIEEIRGVQDPGTYEVSLYTSASDALDGINALEADEIVAYETTTTTLYALVTNVNTGCTNGDPIAVELYVEPLGEVVLTQTGSEVLCIDATNNPIIGTDLGAGYSYLWNTGATTATIEITEGGEYFVEVINTNTINQCSYTSNTVVYQEASLPGVTPRVIQSEAFQGEDTIAVIAEGAGVSEYSYTLETGESNTTGIFTNVAPGFHTITITELNGCGSLAIQVSVIDYMRYFTPNGDGVNDKWRIIGLESQENAQVYIFDRQGKLIKQIAATSEGWNGTFNGTIMPSNDYWFKVVYTEPTTGEVKEFTNHFTLKR